MVIARLVERRWIESEGAGRAMAFRLTEEGLAAKMLPIPDRKKQCDTRRVEVIQHDKGIRVHQAG
jgi:chromosome segregation and condensation protein ScpB